MKKIIFRCTLFLLTCSFSLVQAQVNVTWTDLVGVTASGNSLTNIPPSGWGSGGAATTNELAANTDGWIEMEAQETDTYRVLGLSSSNTNAHYNTINYAIYLYGTGIIKIFENGSGKGSFGSYTTGDILRIDRAGGTVTYKKNGATIYTSNIASTSKLIGDAAFLTVNGTISNVVASFDVPSGNVTDWQLDGANIYYDAGHVAVKTTTTTKAFSIEENGTTQFQINGDGKAFAREVEVTLNPFPDYVFEEDYPLMPLTQLKTFIETNKHLPNIPSAKVVDNEGIGLGDLSHKQMEKIEELTLYLLQMDERLQKLENENAALKDEIKELKSGKKN